MQILINNPIYQTVLFTIVFALVFLFTFVKKTKHDSFSLTQELKGFSILTIIFGHIGYFLSVDHQFLFPLSILSGVGVNFFLFLSGYGLTCSKIKKEESVFQFYKRRLLKLFVPLWIILTIFIGFDYVFLGKKYSLEFINDASFGIFKSADMLTDLNSPLWYFTLILLYYLLLPIFWNKKHPWITSILLMCAGFLIVWFDPKSFSGVIGLYEVHYLTFPLGVLFAWFINSKREIVSKVKEIYVKHKNILYPILLALLIVFIGYFSIYSEVGEKAIYEQIASLSVMSAFGLLFLLKKRESKLFNIFGLYSYEIYLLHWPIVLRYDFIYKYVPAWIATVLYLVLFLLLAWLLKKINKLFLTQNT